MISWLINTWTLTCWIVCVHLPGLSLPCSQRRLRVDCRLQLHLLLPHIHRRLQGENHTIKQKLVFSFTAGRSSYFSLLLFPTAVHLTGENRIRGVVLISASKTLYEHEYFNIWKSAAFVFVKLSCILYSYTANLLYVFMFCIIWLNL